MSCFVNNATLQQRHILRYLTAQTVSDSANAGELRRVSHALSRFLYRETVCRLAKLQGWWCTWWPCSLCRCITTSFKRKWATKVGLWPPRNGCTCRSCNSSKRKTWKHFQVKPIVHQLLCDRQCWFSNRLSFLTSIALWKRASQPKARMVPHLKICWFFTQKCVSRLLWFHRLYNQTLLIKKFLLNIFLKKLLKRSFKNNKPLFLKRRRAHMLQSMVSAWTSATSIIWEMVRQVL